MIKTKLGERKTEFVKQGAKVTPVVAAAPTTEEKNIQKPEQKQQSYNLPKSAENVIYGTDVARKSSGKATYGLNFEASKRADSVINQNSPFAGYRITSKTGARSGVKGGSVNHAGIDRAMAVGTAVALPIDTTYYKSGYDSARGYWIEVKDGNGNILHYQHLRDYGAFTPGQAIPAGTKIASSGNTGSGTGAHLHEEYYRPDGMNITESYWAGYAPMPGGTTAKNEGVAPVQYISAVGGGIPKRIQWSDLERERTESIKDYAAEAKNDDFAALSIYDPSKAKKKRYGLSLGDNDIYRLVNDDDYYREKLAKATAGGGAVADEKYRHMSRSEKNMFNYLYNKYGENEARGFLKSIDRLLNVRILGEKEEEAAELAKKHPKTATAATVVAMPAIGYAGMTRLAANAFGAFKGVSSSEKSAAEYLASEDKAREAVLKVLEGGSEKQKELAERARANDTDALKRIDATAKQVSLYAREYLQNDVMSGAPAFDPISGISRVSKRMRDTVGEKQASKWFGGRELPVVGNVGQFTYSTLTSIADMFSALAFGTSSATSSAAMSGNAALSTYNDAKDRGYNDAQAMSVGVAAGVAEFAFEKWGLEKILKEPKNVILHTLRSMVTEGSEEGLTEIANIFADSLIGGDKSKWRESVAEYVNAGYSAEKAIWKTLGDNALQAFAAGIGGAVAGGVLGGANAAVKDTTRTVRAYTKSGITDTINKLGYTLEETTDPRTEGFVNKDTNTVYINSGAKNPFKAIAKHELTHILEDSGKYGEFITTLKEDSPKLWAAAEQRVKELYKRANAQARAKGQEEIKLDERTLDNEVAAELSEVFKQERYIRNFAIGKENMPFAMKMIELSRDATQRIKEKIGTDRGWSKAQRLWGEALQSTLAQGEGTEYKIVDSVTDTAGKTYKNVVLLDSNLFSGRPREWRKKLRSFVYNNLVEKKLQTSDIAGNVQTVEFAQSKERAKKDGANNSHIVLEKLARKNDRNSMKAVAHADEAIEVSKYINSNNENTHQWLDANGWEFRKVTLANTDGRMYEAILNIAKTRDGRKILYDINNIKNIGRATLPYSVSGAKPNTELAQKRAGLHTIPDTFSASISQPEGKVNTKNEKNNVQYKLAEPEEDISTEVSEEVNEEEPDEARKFTNRLRDERRVRRKEFSGNKWHFQAKELQLAETIIEQLIRENGDKPPKYYQKRQDIQQLRSELRGLEKDNATQREMKDFWKKRAYTLLGVWQEISSGSIKELDVRGFAEELKSATGTHRTAKDIATVLQKEYLRLQKAVNSDKDTAERESGTAYANMLRLAEYILSDAEYTDRSKTDRYSELIKRLKLSGVSITKEEAKGIPDFAGWKKKQTGRVRITRDGTPVNAYYKQLAADYPELFRRNLKNPANQLMEIARIRDSLDPKKLDRGTAAVDLADRMYSRYFSDEATAARNMTAAEVMQRSYEKKYGKKIAERDAEIEYLHKKLNEKDTARERLNERVRKTTQEDVPEEEKLPPTFKEKDMTAEYGKKYAKNINNPNAKIILQSTENRHVKKLFMRFNMQSASDLDTDAEYRRVITKMKTAAEFKEMKNHIKYRFASNEVFRAFDIAFGEDAPVMKRIILDKLDDAKLNRVHMQRFYTDALNETIVKGLGISKGSDMSAAVQYYGEYEKVGRKPEKGNENAEAARLIYERLVKNKEHGAENKEKIITADRIIQAFYTGQLETINEGRRTIYPNAEEHAKKLEEDYAKLQQEQDLISLGFTTGDFEGIRGSAAQWNLITRLAVKGESSERQLHRIMNIASARLESYNGKIEEAERKISETKVDTKAYDTQKRKLARLIEERNAYEKISEMKENDLLKEIEEIKGRLDATSVGMKQALKDRLAEINRKMGEIEAEWKSDEISYGREIKPRANYYHHFRELSMMQSEMKGFIDKMTKQGYSPMEAGDAFMKSKTGIDLRLVSKTEETKPKAKWQGIFQKRKGDFKIKYDAVGGMLDYIPQAAYAATIDPEITIFRKLADDLAEKVNEDDKNNSMALGNFVEYLNLFANDLAGKTAFFDRLVPRELMPYMVKLSGRIKKNQVMFNVSSSLAQVMNIQNGIAMVDDTKSSVKAVKDMFELINGGGLTSEIEKSQFLQERYEDDFSRFDSGLKAAAGRVANFMLGALDEVGTKYIWCAAYNKGIEKGVDPVRYADDITRRSVGGRGVGEMTLLQKNKVIGMLAPFTVEVGNAVRVYGDIAREYQADCKKRGKAISLGKAAKRLAKLWIAQFLLSRILELITGSDGGGFDPIEDIRDGIKNRDGIGGTLGLLAGDALSSLPGGDMIAQLYPEYGISIPFTDIRTTSREKLFGDKNPTRYGTDVFGVFNSLLSDPFYNVIMPGGGRQMKKLVGGAKALFDGGVSDSTGKKLYDVEPTPANVVKALAFGKGTTSGATEYYERNDLPEVKIKTGKTKGFTYNKKKREVTFGSGPVAEKVTLTGDGLERFEKLRFEEYGKGYSLLDTATATVQNTAKGKERIKKNQEMGKILKELRNQGAITQEQFRKLYNGYANGRAVSVPAVAFASGAKRTVKKSYKALTTAQQSQYMKALARLYKNGEISKERYEKEKAAALAGGEVAVKEYITEKYSELSDEEKKAVQQALNRKATDTAKERWSAE